MLCDGLAPSGGGLEEVVNGDLAVTVGILVFNRNSVSGVTFFFLAGGHLSVCAKQFVFTVCTVYYFVKKNVAQIFEKKFVFLI